MPDTLDALLSEFSIEPLPPGAEITRPRQSRAVPTMAKLFREHGAGRLRLTLTVCCETHPRSAFVLARDVLGAVSDITGIIGSGFTADTLDRFDEIDLEDLHLRTGRLPGVIPRRPAIAALIAERLDLLQPKRSVEVRMAQLNVGRFENRRSCHRSRF